MTIRYHGENYWALILGGSSGFGAATARALALAGVNLCLVHRDRKGSMERIESFFNELRSTGVELLTYNTNALESAEQSRVVRELKARAAGKLRLLLHSIAIGNLKLLAPTGADYAKGQEQALQSLSTALGLSKERISSAIDAAFAAGNHRLADLATPVAYDSELFLEDEDFASTIYAMGTSLLPWARLCFDNNLFHSSSRVMGLTSEGNTVAWRGYAAVSAAKVALEALARSMALEYAPYGIRTNIIQAGVTDTPALRLIPGSEQLMAQALRRNPAGRLTRPEDVAGVITLLLSDQAGWINGEVIRVDGGEHISG
ncbi:MAG: SDR family oxidoreductase [Spirochaetales bacterium]|nr:SDR family oxidoreductase [Spirochaetales bacterium]